MLPPTRPPCQSDTPFRTPWCRSPAPSWSQPAVAIDDLTPIQSELPPFKRLMYPHNEVLDHPAGPDWLQYALDGCPFNCRDNWTLKQPEAAVQSRTEHMLVPTYRKQQRCTKSKPLNGKERFLPFSQLDQHQNKFHKEFLDIPTCSSTAQIL
jgi:hypothetical protein